MAISMLLVYKTVLEQEKKASRWSFSGLRFHKIRQQQQHNTTTRASTAFSPNNVRIKHSRKVANQAMLFVLAFLMTWFFGTLTRILDLTKHRTYFPIVILHVLFLPCQGFFNALVYLRPRYIRHVQRHPEDRPTKLWRKFKRSRSSMMNRSTGSPEDDGVDDEDYCVLPPTGPDSESISSSFNEGQLTGNEDEKRRDAFDKNAP